MHYFLGNPSRLEQIRTTPEITTTGTFDFASTFSHTSTAHFAELIIIIFVLYIERASHGGVFL